MKAFWMQNFCKFILLGFFFIPVGSLAELIAEPEVEDIWVVNFIAETTVHASVNGKTTHGDRLRVRLVKENCEKANLLTTVYTYSEHPKLTQIKGRLVSTRFMGQEVLAKVVYIAPFLLGHSATIDLGWAELEQMQAILGRKSLITIEFIDSDEFKSTDFFDITQNSWSNKGVEDALIRAQQICKKM